MSIPTLAVPATISMAAAQRVQPAERSPLRVEHHGLRSLCVAYVLHQSQVVLLSLAGTAIVNRGLWAALVSNELLEITESQVLVVRRVPSAEREAGVQTLARRKTPSDYKTYRKRLAETGKQHLVIVHRQATGECVMDGDFFVLGDAGRDGPPLERFSRQFALAVACAARPTWSEYLWREGLVSELIMPCSTYGLGAWLVHAEAEAWQGIVRRGINQRIIF